MAADKRHDLLYSTEDDKNDPSWDRARTDQNLDILIEENAPRDGLQNESVLLSPEERVALVNELSVCGFRRIQVGSFVNPKKVPQMADTERVFACIVRQPQVIYSALVLNENGLHRALECGVEHISVFASASEAHSMNNIQCGVREAVRNVLKIIGIARERGAHVQAGVMNAFGCQIEGGISHGRVVEMAVAFAAAGAEEINLADTAGVANPSQIEEMLKRVRDHVALPLALHLHDTFGFGMANVHAAWKMGVRRFDASCGGLGGCPFIPHASGNVPTEDLVHFFVAQGVETGISLEKLATVILRLELRLGRRLPGRYAHLMGEACKLPR